MQSQRPLKGGRPMPQEQPLPSEGNLVVFGAELEPELEGVMPEAQRGGPPHRRSSEREGSSRRRAQQGNTCHRAGLTSPSPG